MEQVGYQQITGDAQIGSGPVAIYGINLISGGSASTLALKNGTSSSGTLVIQEKGTASQGVSFAYGGKGIVFPGGCFADADANISSATIWYRNLP